MPIPWWYLDTGFTALLILLAAIQTCPPIQFRPPAPASASPSMNWSLAGPRRGDSVRRKIDLGLVSERARGAGDGRGADGRPADNWY